MKALLCKRYAWLNTFGNSCSLYEVEHREESLILGLKFTRLLKSLPSLILKKCPQAPTNRRKCEELWEDALRTFSKIIRHVHPTLLSHVRSFIRWVAWRALELSWIFKISFALENVPKLCFKISGVAALLQSLVEQKHRTTTATVIFNAKPIKKRCLRCRLRYNSMQVQLAVHGNTINSWRSTVGVSKLRLICDFKLSIFLSPRKPFSANN